MKHRCTAFITISVTSLFAVALPAQTARNTRSHTAGSSASVRQAFPSPTNLKVLPKTLSGLQVHNIMKQWSTELGVRCSACHVRDLEAVTPGGSSHGRFAEDSKPMKRIARLMYAMTAEINRKYIISAKQLRHEIDCGTCHRGNLKPAPFVPPRHDEGAVNHAAPGGSIQVVPAVGKRD